MSVLGKPFSVATEFFFLAGADPYFTNVVKDPSEPTRANIPWLSEDLRVFTATPGAQYQYPVPGRPPFLENSSTGGFVTNGAYAYIQSLLLYLDHNYGDPTGIDPFEPGSNVIPRQQPEFTADFSVAPFSTINGGIYRNYSFAVARVRLKGSQGSAGVAKGGKVFFRLWGTQTADTGWNPSSTYLSHTDGSGNPLWPLAPSDNHTVPLFATSALPNFGAANDPEFQPGGFTNTGANNLTITINQGDSQWAYFGCFLNVNDPSSQVNGVLIWKAFPGTHHCLAAEIAYADSRIQIAGGITPTPECSDQLAQRNLQVTTSDNPEPASRASRPANLRHLAERLAAGNGSTNWPAGRIVDRLGHGFPGVHGPDLLPFGLERRGDPTCLLDVWRASIDSFRRTYDRGPNLQWRDLRAHSAGDGPRPCRTIHRRPAADGEDRPGVRHRGVADR